MKDFDIVKEAGGPNRALMKEFKGILVKDTLYVELQSSKGVALLCGLEALMENGGTVAKLKTGAQEMSPDQVR